MSQNKQQTVYRTRQVGKHLRQKHVGPLFSTREEAKRAMEHFIENEHGGVVTEWEDADGPTEKMWPDRSSSVFIVSEIPVRDSLEELFDEPDVDDGEEVNALAD